MRTRASPRVSGSWRSSPRPTAPSHRSRAASTPRSRCRSPRTVRRRARPHDGCARRRRRARMEPMTATRDPGALLAASRVKLGEFEYEIGPLGHLAAERERLQQLTWRAFDATPVGSTIGAEIDGVALGDSAVMWDNRAVQHYVCSDYWPSVR